MSKENIWAEIDGSVASLVGQRVFYNHDGVKCLAFVVKAGYDRNTDGQIVNKLAVFAQDGDTFIVDAALSSDRRVGTFDIAQPGDLTDSAATPRPEPAATTAPLPEIEASESNQAFDPADANKDGFVSNKERKQHEKGE